MAVSQRWELQTILVIQWFKGVPNFEYIALRSLHGWAMFIANFTSERVQLVPTF